MILASFLHHAKLSSALFAFSARNGLVRLEQIHILQMGSSNHSETTKSEFSPFFTKFIPGLKNGKDLGFIVSELVAGSCEKVKSNERNVFLLNLKKKKKIWSLPTALNARMRFFDSFSTSHI